MKNQQTVSRGLLYGTIPPQFAGLNISNDLFEDEFEWDESETQYNRESLANNVLAFLKEIETE